MRLKYGIAVAGSHGKTTTTSMVAVVLDRAGTRPDDGDWRPRHRARDDGASSAGSDLMVVEADESDRSFLSSVARHRGGDGHRPRAHGSYRDLGRSRAGLRGLRQQGAVLRELGALSRRRAHPGPLAARPPARTSPTASRAQADVSADDVALEGMRSRYDATKLGGAAAGEVELRRPGTRHRAQLARGGERRPRARRSASTRSAKASRASRGSIAASR